MNLAEINAMKDSKLNRKDRRSKEKKTGISIQSVNVPYTNPGKIRSKKSKWNPFNLRQAKLNEKS